MHPKLAEAFATLDRWDERIPLNALEDWLRSTRLRLEDLTPFMCFSQERYVRNLIYSGRAFQALLLCWRNGQRSPIHDHHAANCAVLVVSGEVVETKFEYAANGMVYPVSSCTLPEGAVTASADRQVHQMSNLQPGRSDLITLHLYSPPLPAMHVFSLADDSITRYVDPINEQFAGGAGI